MAGPGNQSTHQQYIWFPTSMEGESMKTSEGLMATMAEV